MLVCSREPALLVHTYLFVFWVRSRRYLETPAAAKLRSVIQKEDNFNSRRQECRGKHQFMVTAHALKNLAELHR